MRIFIFKSTANPNLGAFSGNLGASNYRVSSSCGVLRRFTAAPEAIRFAVEEFPAVRTLAHGCRWEKSASTPMASDAAPSHA